MSKDTVIVTTVVIEENTTKTKKVKADVTCTGQDLYHTTGTAMIDDKLVRVYKDHEEGPYAPWRYKKVYE